MKFEDYSLKGFIDQLSSDAPSPGGGSTAALVGALAGSLNSMVYSLTVGRKAFEELSEENKKELLNLSSMSKEFTKKSLEYMEKDREDFTSLMACFKMPKDTEEEKQKRSTTIQECTFKAMNTPLELAKDSLKFYNNIKFAINYGNKNLVSDGVVATILLHATIESALVNVKINLYSLKDKDLVNKTEIEMDSIIRESLIAKEELVKLGEERMK